MSQQITTALSQGYHSAVEIQFQQQGSRLRETVDVVTQGNEFDYYDRIEATAAEKRTTRHADTPLMETPHSRRRLAMEDYEWADLIDSQDKIRMLSDPTSEYAINAAWAHGRSLDEEIIAAATGTSFSGKTGATSVTHPTASQIAVDYVETGAAVNSGLTVGKLRQARFLFDSLETIMDGEKIWLIHTAKQMQDLLRTTEVTSHDFNTVKALVRGDVDEFMGFTFKRTNLLAVSSDIRTCLAYPQSAIKAAIGSEIVTRVEERADKGYSTQVYTKSTCGATRMWEEKVLDIACDES